MVVIGQCDAIRVIQLAMQTKRRESFRRRIETKYLVRKAVRDENIAGFAHNQVVESVLPGVTRRKPVENFAVRPDMQQSRAARARLFLPGVSPNGAVVRIKADS